MCTVGMDKTNKESTVRPKVPAYMNMQRETGMKMPNIDMVDGR